MGSFLMGLGAVRVWPSKEDAMSVFVSFSDTVRAHMRGVLRRFGLAARRRPAPVVQFPPYALK